MVLCFLILGFFHIACGEIESHSYLKCDDFHDLGTYAFLTCLYITVSDGSLPQQLQ